MNKKCEKILKELETEDKLKVWWDFKFPEKEELKLRLKDVLEDNVEEKYYLSEEVASKYVQSKENNTNVIGNLVMDKWQDYMKRIYDIEKYSPTINTMQGGNIEPKVLIKNTFRIRKLTPKECWRLMGFSDEDFEKTENIPTSNTQLYKMAGNSIVVNVLEKIFENLLGEML